MLKRSKDSKVTTGVSPNGKRATIANSFGLPSGSAFSCPGATSICEKVCYAGKLESIRPNVRNVMLHNWNLVQNADYNGLVNLLDEMIFEFVKDSNKRGAEKAFRIHWDGDFFSEEYAEAWSVVIRNYPDVQFWVYTRSFTPALNVIPILHDIPNLTTYLSVDSDNVKDAVKVRKQYPSVKWAWLANTFAEGREEMPQVGKTYDCPENKGSLPLINEKGSACIRCNVCVKGRGDVVFSIGKR